MQQYNNFFSDADFLLQYFERMRQKQIDIEKKRIKTILELKMSIDISNRIQEERNNLIREFLSRNNQHEGEKNT